jgi:uncharacterized glyoxalase superfamily protein PhnB
MQVNPYLFFKGQCKEAFKLYATCLGGNIEAMLSYEGTAGRITSRQNGAARSSMPAWWWAARS